MTVKHDQVADAILDTLISVNEHDSNLEAANVVDALFSIARSLSSLSTQVKYLGGGENTDQRGAVEVLAVAVGEGCQAIAGAIDGLAVSIDHLADVQQAR
jgi:hypothetical protein